MTANSLFSASSSLGVLLHHHSRRVQRAAAALALGLLGSTWASAAHAELAPGPWEHGGADKRTDDASKDDEPKIEVMLRASYANLHVGMLGAGVEGTYMLTPHLGFGGTVEGFVVDNGADPQYSEPGTLSRGVHALGFVEGDLFKGVFTPYARFGIGAGQYARFQLVGASGSYLEAQPEMDFVAQAQLGVALRLGPVLARGSVSPSIYGKDALVVYAVALGGRF